MALGGRGIGTHDQDHGAERRGLGRRERNGGAGIDDRGGGGRIVEQFLQLSDSETRPDVVRSASNQAMEFTEELPRSHRAHHTGDVRFDRRLQAAAKLRLALRAAIANPS